MTTTTDTREMILEAAMQRIMHYGYAKTTMSEIAKDCGMSAGNIYRFFASKLDIAEAMARKYHQESLACFNEIAARESSATLRLTELLHFRLRATFEKLGKDDKILEVAEILTEERPTYANEELALERVPMMKILNDGVALGEFAPMDDPEFTAEMLQVAMLKFSYPQLFSSLSLDQLERELRGVLPLVLAGLKAGFETKL